MIKYLTNQFKPEKLYNIVDKSIIFFGFFTIILIITGTAWALLYSPSDYQQGETVRLIYIHVPAAILSLFTYFCMAVFAFISIHAERHFTGGSLRLGHVVGSDGGVE